MSPTFKLRPWTHTDIESLAKHANNPKIAANLTDMFPSPYTVEDAERFINMASVKNPASIFAIEINGEACGGIGLHQQQDINRKNMELGYWLCEEQWGKGIITKAVKQMVDYGFRTFDVVRIFARPFGSNIASQKVLEKAGFIKEAHIKQNLFKNGNYEDELIYAIRRPI